MVWLEHAAANGRNAQLKSRRWLGNGGWNPWATSQEWTWSNKAGISCSVA